MAMLPPNANMSRQSGPWQPGQGTPGSRMMTMDAGDGSNVRPITPGQQYANAQSTQTQPQATQQPQGQQVSPAYVGQTPNAQTYYAPNVQQVQAGNIMQMAGGNLGYNAAQSNVNLDPSSFISSVYGALSPQFAQQQHGLNEQLANAGIVGGSGIGAQQQLGLQQQAQFQGDIQPILSQLKGYELSQSQGNQLAQNQASQFGAGQNLSAAEQQAQLGLQGQEANQSSGLQGGEFNANQANAMNQFNIGNAIKAAMQDSGSYNSILSQLLGFQNQDWLGQLQAQAGLNSQAMGGQTGAYQPVFQQPAPFNPSQMAGLAGLAPSSNIGTGSYTPPGGGTPVSYTPPPGGGYDYSNFG